MFLFSHMLLCYDDIMFLCSISLTFLSILFTDFLKIKIFCKKTVNKNVLIINYIITKLIK